MDDASIKRIGTLLGALVAVGFALYEGFCGLVLGHLSLVSRSTTLAGSDSQDVEFTGLAARGLGLAFLLAGFGVGFFAVRSARES